MAVHPRLKTFFGGAYSTLAAAYERSIGSGGTCTGMVREVGIREALRNTVPSIARIHHGEIIDARHEQTGQIDGIVVHGGYPAFGGSESDAEPRIVPAEGVVAVIESKSNMKKHWGEIEAMWKKVIPIRRDAFDPLRPPTVRNNPAIPLIVVGYKGWSKKQDLGEKAQELWEMYERSLSAARFTGSGMNVVPPPVYVFQVDPAGFAVAKYSRTLPGLPELSQNLVPPWRLMALLATTVGFHVADHPIAPVDYSRYVKPDEGDADALWKPEPKPRKARAKKSKR